MGICVLPQVWILACMCLQPLARSFVLVQGVVCLHCALCYASATICVCALQSAWCPSTRAHLCHSASS